MVTLAGPGGIGKTRLALHVLAGLADEFPDGACYAELADVTSADLVAARVAAAVGVTEEDGRPLLDTLADALRPRSLVLALDNCEHLLDACAGLCGRLLAAAPDLRLMATSREPLRVAGETVWQVPPLAAESADGSTAEAVRLFADRAAAIAPGFALTPDNAGPVAAICRSLDGMPLAIELAAARIRALSVEQIRMRVTDRFGLLTTGDRAAAARQRTLRATIDWSHDLLTEREQVLLRRLSVFAGWSLDMAEDVCADELVPPAALLDTVAALVDKSLVVREPEVLGQARFRMLDTIREYAAEKLALAGEATRLQHRLRDHVLGVAERNFAVGMALVPAPWQDRVDVFRRYDVDARERLAGARRVPGRGRRRDRAADLHGDQAVHAGARRVRPRQRLARRLPRPAGGGRTRPGDQGAGAHRAGPAVPAERPGRRRAVGPGRTRAVPRGGRPVLDGGRTQPAQRDRAAHGQPRQGRGSSAGRRWPSPRPPGTAGTPAGRSASAPRSPGVRGDIREAAELAGASIEVMASIDHRWGVARAELGLGDLARMRGDLAQAHHMYGDALGYLREVGAQPEIARCLSGLGRVALDQGDTAAAREYLTESLRVCRDIGTRIGIARGLESFAALADREGDAERAVLLAAASAGLRAASGLPPPTGARTARYLAAADRLGAGRGRAAVGTRPRAPAGGRH